MSNLHLYDKPEILSRTNIREGETKLGEVLDTLALTGGSHSSEQLESALQEQRAKGKKYALFGITEDIGVRANAGRPGAGGAWDAFLDAFLNIQANHFIKHEDLLLVGKLEFPDLLAEAQNLDSSTTAGISRLRELCAEIDRRVEIALKPLFFAGFEVIAVGGGHNNSFPIMQALAAAQKQAGHNEGVVCINCDPHADFRKLEGRHSGNGFRAAFEAGVLKAYFVLGLQEGYNSHSLLKSFEAARFAFATYEDIKIRGKLAWEDALAKGIEYLENERSLWPVGLDLDLDSIAYLPASAESPNGLTSEEAACYIYAVASSFADVAYCYLAEGAPSLHGSLETGRRVIGRVLVNQVAAYVKGRSER